jgi:uncharacterized protein YndB with AHSA1/START domain
MERMLKTEASTIINRPVEETWKLISDWDNFVKSFVLQPGEEIKKTSDGPIAMGSRIELKGKFMGRKMVIGARVSEFEPNRKITIEYTSGSFKGSKKIYELEPNALGQKTNIIHISEGEFHGLWKILEFLLKPMALGGLKKTTKEELDKISQSVSS